MLTSYNGFKLFLVHCLLICFQQTIKRLNRVQIYLKIAIGTIWRAIQISSPNLVSIRLLTVSYSTLNILKFFLKMASGFNLESCPNQLSKFGYYQTTDRLQTDFGQSFDRLTLNPITDTKKFVGDDNRSQFGELSKSALQIWRVIQISSPNLVTIRLLKDSSQTPNGLWRHTYIKPQNSL